MKDFKIFYNGIQLCSVHMIYSYPKVDDDKSYTALEYNLIQNILDLLHDKVKLDKFIKTNGVDIKWN